MKVEVYYISNNYVSNTTVLIRNKIYLTHRISVDSGMKCELKSVRENEI